MRGGTSRAIVCETLSRAMETRCTANGGGRAAPWPRLGSPPSVNDINCYILLQWGTVAPDFLQESRSSNKVTTAVIEKPLAECLLSTEQATRPLLRSRLGRTKTGSGESCVYDALKIHRQVSTDQHGCITLSRAGSQCNHSGRRPRGSGIGRTHDGLWPPGYNH